MLSKLCKKKAKPTAKVGTESHGSYEIAGLPGKGNAVFYCLKLFVIIPITLLGGNHAKKYFGHYGFMDHPRVLSCQ